MRSWSVCYSPFSETWLMVSNNWIPTVLYGNVLILPIFVSTSSWCCDQRSLSSVQPTHNMTSEHQLGQISQSTIWYLCLTTDSSCVLWLELPSAQPMQSTEHVPRNFLNHSRDFLSKCKQDLHPTWRDTEQSCGGKNEVGCLILRRKYQAINQFKMSADPPIGF